MCGSGTFAIEAAMIAGDIAPGLLRDYYGFFKWKGHDEVLWNNLLQEAEQKKTKGLKNIPRIYALDNDKKAISAARLNVKKAGLYNFITIIHSEFNELKNVNVKITEHGLIAVNPPYGERLNNEKDLDMLTICDEPQVAVEAVQRWYHGQEIIGEKALLR